VDLAISPRLEKPSPLNLGKACVFVCARARRRLSAIDEAGLHPTALVPGPVASSGSRVCVCVCVCVCVLARGSLVWAAGGVSWLWFPL
jgi:hypothetical protein